jgi:hypothetical protein
MHGAVRVAGAISGESRMKISGNARRASLCRLSFFREQPTFDSLTNHRSQTTDHLSLLLVCAFGFLFSYPKSAFRLWGPQKKRSAFSAERFHVVQTIRYSTSINSGSPTQITRSVYTKPSTLTETQQPSTNTKYVLPINRKWLAPKRWTKNSFGCWPRLNTSL